DHAIAVFLEDLARDGPERLLVLHQEDGLRPPHEGCGYRELVPGGGLVDAREVDLEGGASPQLAVHGYIATGLLHRSVHHGQAEAGALPFLLGREARLRDVFTATLSPSAA